MPQNTHHPKLKLDEQLEPVLNALRRFKVIENMSHKQAHKKPELENIVLERQHDSELSRLLQPLHGADAGQLLEMLPGGDRYKVWRNLSKLQAGEALLEVTGHVVEDLLAKTDEHVLLEILTTIDPDEINLLKEYISKQTLETFKQQLEENNRRQLEASLPYEEGTIGELMKQDFICVSEALSVDATINMLRGKQSLPAQTDQIFVSDETLTLLGSVTLSDLLLHQGESRLGEIMNTELMTFEAAESSKTAGQAFERYDLISAPVVDTQNHLIGRITVETVMDNIRERAEDQALATAGLSEDTDLFGPIWKSARERWLWLAINLCTAFIATRFIALFEETLEQIVALAILMPIVASIGGNTGNQTIALFVRGLALGQIKKENFMSLLRKEIMISVINGLLWGGLLAAVISVMYQDISLGLVMMAAMTLNLLLAASIGVLFPLMASRMGKDPAMGSSVVLTFTTDSMGFFIFLGLATLFLI